MLARRDRAKQLSEKKIGNSMGIHYGRIKHEHDAQLPNGN